MRIVSRRGVVDAGINRRRRAWVKSLLPDVTAPLRVTRQAMVWFARADRAPFAPGNFPVFLIGSHHGIHYGFPPFGDAGIKVAKHHHRDQTVDPESHDRTVSADDVALIRTALADHVPSANGKLIDAKSCLYTVAPDGDFVIDRLPAFPQVILASPCSGHGFKFAPVIGEILADLATTGRRLTSRFSLKRFG